MSGELRPVGTEFEITQLPDKSSTSLRREVIRYRVIAHIKALRFHGDVEGEIKEEVKIIEIRRKEKDEG